MKNQEVADILNRMGVLLEIKDDNVFKIRAYHKAADTISNLGEDIAIVKQENRLCSIPGIGKTLEEKIVEFLDTGKMTAYQKLTNDIPESILEVVNVPSVGPKKAKLFYEELKVKNIAGLKKAAEKGKLLDLPGIKEKTVENILKGISVVEEGQERMNLGMASRVAEEIIASLKKLKEVEQISTAGSLRRAKETVRDIDILIDSSSPEKIMKTFVSLPQVKQINVQGDTKSSILTKDNVQVDLRVVDKESFGAALLYFTGSKNFNVKLRQIAIKKKMKVNEYGIFKVKGKKEECVASKTEKDCFKSLGLPYIAPELREDIGAQRLFSGKPLPKLVELKDIQGEIHVHSTYSDGKNTIKEMAEAAKERGYQYLAISDHSQKLRVARGVSPEDLKKKKKEIEGLNKKMKGFSIFLGTEIEIDSNGDLDYNDKILSEFDIVVASIHTGFEQSSRQLTNRMIKAIKNKYVTAIAHPMGVHIGKRKAYDIDFKDVCKAAADHNTFLEINSFPIRLDLNSSNAYFAHEMGVKFVINTDAHSVKHLDFMKFGVSIARRAWLTKKDVVNAMALKEFEKEIKR